VLCRSAGVLASSVVTKESSMSECGSALASAVRPQVSLCQTGPWIHQLGRRLPMGGTTRSGRRERWIWLSLLIDCGGLG
jgi:hypothetical protein